MLGRRTARSIFSRSGRFDVSPADFVILILTCLAAGALLAVAFL
jgi:hypothetical protein